MPPALSDLDAKRSSPAIPSVEDETPAAAGHAADISKKGSTSGTKSGRNEDVGLPAVDEPGLARIADLIKSGKAKNIVVMTGAGISTSAGIPDFRSPETGLYANLEKLNLPFPEAVFQLDYFRRNPKPFWVLAKDLYPGKYLPTLTHYFLSLMHEHSHLLRVFSQNIDTLESLAGLPTSKIIEAHGSFATSHCLTCRAEASREYVLENGVREGKVVKCGKKVKGKAGTETVCGGLVKPDIVFFGEDLPDRFFDSLSDLKKCDLLIVIGTSLQVTPFSSLTSHVSASTPRLLINLEAVGPFARLPNSRAGSAKEDKASKGGLKKMLSDLYGAEEEDGTPERDIWWGGPADEGCEKLAEALGWAEELQQAVAEGQRKLKAEWALSVAPAQNATAEVLELAKKVAEAEHDEAPTPAQVQRKDAVPSGLDAEGDADRLDNLLDDKLRISDQASK